MFTSIHFIASKMKHKIEIPNKVSTIIFCYLRLIDLIEVSAACKRFYRVIHTMPYYVKKLDESKELFTSRDFLLEAYENIFKRFYDGVKWDVLDIVCMNKLDKLNHELFSRTYFEIMPFHVWSHLWFCCRSHHCKFMISLWSLSCFLVCEPVEVLIAVSVMSISKIKLGSRYFDEFLN